MMAFLLVVTTSLWLYNLLDLRKEIENGVSAARIFAEKNCLKRSCKVVTYLPDYTILFASVVSQCIRSSSDVMLMSCPKYPGN